MIIGKSGHASVESNANVTNASTPFSVEYIYMLTNDGTDDIYFNFDAPADAGGTTITVKAGESLAEFPRTVSVLHYRSKSGTQPFRAWGVK